MNLLQINTSLFAHGGQSSHLAEHFVSEWQAHHPDAEIRRRDFAEDEIPHLTADRFNAFITPQDERNADQQSIVDYSDALIAELQQADVIVLGLPMYNFGVPSQLKAWFDHIARAGITFRYTENGPEGLLTGKKAYVLAARGGKYKGTPLDTQTDFVKNFFNFIGITDVKFIYAEGLNMGDEPKEQALTEAHRAIDRLAA